MRDHRGRLPLLPPPNLDAQVRAIVVAPRGLHEYVATVTVPRFGDGALPFAGSTRVLARDESEVRGELAGTLEAPPIDDLRRQDHRRAKTDPAEALESPHRRGKRGQEGELLDLPIELVAPLQLVREERVVLAKDEPIGRRQR